MSSATLTLSAGQIDGPWTCGFYCDLPAPASKSNARRYSKANAAERRAWERSKSFAQTSNMIFHATRPGRWKLPPKGLEVAERPTVVALLVSVTTLDAGNVPKTLLDAGQGALYESDAEIACVTSLVAERSMKGQWVQAAFAQLPAGPSARDVGAAQQQLLTWSLEQGALAPDG